MVPGVEMMRLHRNVSVNAEHAREFPRITLRKASRVIADFSG
jgi:hypothetical protein